MRLAIAVVAAMLLACGGGSDEEQCNFVRETDRTSNGWTVVSLYRNADRGLVAWCEMPGTDAKRAEWYDADGRPTDAVYAACLENLPESAPARVP